MGLFSKPVSDKELRDFKRGKTVSARVAREAVKRDADRKAQAKATREAKAARAKGLKASKPK